MVFRETTKGRSHTRMEDAMAPRLVDETAEEAGHDAME